MNFETGFKKRELLGAEFDGLGDFGDAVLEVLDQLYAIPGTEPQGLDEQ